MIGLRRQLVLPVGLLALATAFQAPAFAADEVSDTFQEGVQALREGRQQEALKAFQRVLALDPSQEAAYALWQSVDEDIWLRMLIEDGEMELVARRFLDLASIGHAERQNDPDAIRALLEQVQSDDVRERTDAIRKLAANHGEFAVPFLLYGLADQENGDRRVIFMQTLTRMGDDVVLPMLAGLESPDAFLRRNIALTLGYIGDPRANGELAHHAANDADGAVRDAAADALARCGGSEDVVGQLLSKGERTYRMDPEVLAPHQVGPVTWSWAGTGIESTEVPRYFYAAEVAKTSFAKALEVDPTSNEALAALSGTIAAQMAELDVREGAGLDIGDWRDRLASDQLAVGIAGAGALDGALGWALSAGDATAASGIVQALASTATSATPNLEQALEVSSSGAVRGEAAIALGHIAVRSGAAPSPAAIAALGEATGREVVRIAVVIDADAARREAVVAALAAEGVMATPFENGARGLVGLRTLPGTDLVVLSDEPGGVTAFQVLAELERSERLSGLPTVMLSADAEGAQELYGDKVGAIVAGPEDAATMLEAMTEQLNADRAEADALAARAAGALSHLAASGLGDLSSAASSLTNVLAFRPDEVAIPALGALNRIGGGDQVASIAAVLMDGERSDALRSAAGDALAGIFSRAGAADEATLAGLIEVCRSDAPQAVRLATSTALGRLDLSPEVRSEILRAVRAGAGS